MKKLAHRSSALKKIIVTFLLSVGCFAGAAQAAPSATASLNNAYQSGQHLYAKVGYMAYYLNLPKFSPAVSDGTTNAPLMTKKFTHNLANMLTLALGYHFVNQSFLTSIFGTQNAVELSGAQFNYNDTNRLKNGMGFIWKIDGTGNTKSKELTFSDTSLKTKVDFHQVALNWKGLKQLTVHVFMTPEIGVVYANLDTKYDFSTYYKVFVLGTTDIETEKLKATYYGLHLGDRFDYQATPYFAPYVSLSADLLHGYAKLNAHQTTFMLVPSVSTYSVSKTKSTAVDLRVTGLLGVKINFFRQPNLPYLNIYGGFDYWNWMPQASVPHASGQVTHIKIRTAVNAMVGVELTIPFS